MRPFTTFVAAVLTVVLLPMALLSSWVAGVVTDTDRYVSTVAPLASDPAVRKAATARLNREATLLVADAAEANGVQDFLDANGFASLNAAARAFLARAISQAVIAVVQSPQFATAWEEANRLAHRQLVAVLEGDDDAVLDAEGRVSVELGVVLNTIAADLQSQGLVPDGAIPEVQTSFALVDADNLTKARDAYRVLQALGFWLPVLWLIAFLVTLVGSRSRAAMLRRLGALAFASMIGLFVGLGAARSEVVGSSPDGAVTGAIWDVVVRSLERAIWITAAVSFVVLLGAVLIQLRQKEPGRSLPRRASGLP